MLVLWTKQDISGPVSGFEKLFLTSYRPNNQSINPKKGIAVSWSPELRSKQCRNGLQLDLAVRQLVVFTIQSHEIIQQP